MNILWGISASVAAIRADRLMLELERVGKVRAVATDKALHFIAHSKLKIGLDVVVDRDEWSTWKKLGDEVLHIELRRWADVFVIAPASADLLAKLAQGISDNLLLSVARAWDFNKPIIVAPAMNTMMWDHPITRVHLDTLRSWGYHMIDPISKELACKDVGMGAMEDPHLIAEQVKRIAGS